MITIGSKRVFTLDEAQDLLPVILKITEKYDKLVKQASRKPDGALVDSLLNEWQGKMKRLGVEGKGIWLVDFDNGTGYFCWKYPEPVVCYCHGYAEGMNARQLVPVPSEASSP